MKKTFFVFAAIVSLATAMFAQDNKLDPSRIPDSAASAAGFAPDGWKVEADVVGDLNDDGRADHAITLIEDKKVDKDEPLDAARALVLAFADGSSLRKAAVATSLLQCTSCGGAFYGVMPAPADVKIEKGVLVVSQEHGSREVTETTYRFRYDEQPEMFILIGFDYNSRDRANGDITTESTNYLTGKRLTTTGRGKRTRTKTSVVQKMRYSITELDGDDFEYQATHRLGLD